MMSSSFDNTPNDGVYFSPRLELPDENPLPRVVPFEARYGPVPNYTPTSSIADLYGFRKIDPEHSGLFVSELRVRGWPEYLIRRIASTLDNDNKLEKRFDEVRAVQQRRVKTMNVYHDIRKRKVTPDFSTAIAKGSGRVSNFWKFPTKYFLHAQESPEPDPTLAASRPKIFFSMARRFLAWKALQLHQTKKKREFVGGNHAAELFAHPRCAIPKDNLYAMFMKAFVFLVDPAYDDKLASPPPITIPPALVARFPSVTVRHLYVHGVQYDLNSFAQVAALIDKKFKPVVRVALSYLEGHDIHNGRGINLPQIEGTLKTAIPPPLPVSTEKIEDDSEVIAYDAPSYRYPRTRYAHFKMLDYRKEHNLKRDEKNLYYLKRGRIRQPTHADYLVDAMEIKQYVVLQGNAPPIGVRVQHEVNLDSLTDALSASLGDTDKPVRCAVQIASLIASLVNASESRNPSYSCLLAISQFVAGNDFAYQKVKSLLSRFQVLVPQGSISGFMKEFVNLFLSSTFMVLISELTSSIRDLVSEPILHLIASTRFSFVKGVGEHISKILLDGIKEISGRISSCWETKSLRPLLGRSWDPQAWLLFVEQSVTQYVTITNQTQPKELEKLRKDGMVPSSWVYPVPKREYCRIMQAEMVTGRDMARHYHRIEGIGSALQRVVERTTAFISSLESNIGSNHTRVSPFSVFCFGVAGAGKTNAIQNLQLAIARKFHLDPSGTYRWVPTSNFQDGFDHTKWCVDMDDVDQTIAPPTAGAPNWCESFLALKNNFPYQVEQARVELKGLVYGTPTFLTFATNFPDARIKEFSIFPDAFFRRIDVWSEWSAKPAFAILDAEGNSTGKLDPRKADTSDTHDMFDIQVRLYDPSYPDNYHMKLYKVMDLTEFFVFCEQRMEKHLEREQRMLERKSCDHGYCLTCFQSSNLKCGCAVTEVPQGFEEWKASLSLRYLEWKQGHASCCQRSNLLVQVKEQLRLSREYVRIAWNLRFCQQWFNENKRLFGAVAAAAILIPLAVRQLSQGRMLVGEKGPTQNWFRADLEYTPGLPLPQFAPTFTRSELEERLRKCLVEVRGPIGMWAFVLSSNMIILPTHGARLGEVVTLAHDGVVINVQVTNFNRTILVSNAEMCLLTVGGLKPCAGLLKMLWSAVDEQILQFDAVEIWGSDVEYTPNVNNIRMHQGVRVLTTNAQTAQGDCGFAYLGCVNGNWRVVGFHYMALVTTGLFGAHSDSVAALVTQQEVERLCATLTVIPQGCVVAKSTFAISGEPSVSRIPVMSEVWAAVTAHNAAPHIFGTLTTQLSGNTMTTGVRHSLVRSYFEDLEEEWCGKKGYWTTPVFKGKMMCAPCSYVRQEKESHCPAGHDLMWHSAYTECFTTENRVQIPDKLLWIAIADYLSGVDGLDNTGYVKLSEAQALKGVPGTWVHSVNVKTSVGPPFFRKKTQFVDIRSDVPAMSPEMWAMFDEIDGIAEEDIPIVLGYCTRKDEVIKSGKWERIFTNLPASFNLWMKQNLSSVGSFMRAYPLIFECMIGINMSGKDSIKVVIQLATICKELDKILTRDTKKQDKSFSTSLWDFIAYVFYGLQFYLGLDAKKAYQVVRAVQNTVCCIKGDLFCSFWNPSGQDRTGEFNSLGQSCGERCIYYEKILDRFTDEEVLEYKRNFFSKPIWIDERFTFRKNVGLCTYGDDVINAWRNGVPDDYFLKWKTLIGLEVTDGEKNDPAGPIAYQHISEAQFLKRCYTWMPEVATYVPRLSKKSIVRMVLFKKESVLTDADSAAENMTCAMKEMVYYGESEYEAFRARCQVAAKDCHLVENPRFISRDFQVWIDQIKAGCFQTWPDGTVLPSDV